MAERRTVYLAIDNDHTCVELVWPWERELGNKQSSGTVGRALTLRGDHDPLMSDASENLREAHDLDTPT